MPTLFPDGYTAYTDKLNENSIVSAEAHTVPATAPYQISLVHPVKQLIPSDIVIPGFTEVNRSPGVGEFDVDYLANPSKITFNVGNVGQAVTVTYTTRGDFYKAEHVNDVQDGIERIEQNIGLNAEGSESNIADRLDVLESVLLVLYSENEELTGTVDGSNPTFILANTPIAGSEKIYVRGVRQRRGAANDYTIVGDTVTFTATAIPQTGDGQPLCDSRYTV